MIRLSFRLVKSHYKLFPHEIHICTMRFPNTCAIRMSEAVVKASPGVLPILKKSGRNVCPHGYVRGAQDLGAALARPDLLGPRTFGCEKPGSAPSKIAGQQGIICFMNIPSFGGQGHIDLWDGTKTVGPNSEYWDASPIWFWKLAP